MPKSKMRTVKRGVKNTLASAAMSAVLLWTVTGTYTLEFFTPNGNVKIVDVDIDNTNTQTGDFTAIARNESGQIYEVVGTVVGDKVELELANPHGGDRIVAVGEIDEDGNLAGRAADANGQEFEWETTEGAARRVHT